MKGINLIFIAIALLGVSCDEVNDPFIHRDDISDDFGNPTFNDTVISDTTSTDRVILIEDFTGHKCPNCPRATDIGKALTDAHPNNVFVLGIHNSNNFSKPDPPLFPADFETVAGENLRLEFGVESFPNGVINRMPIGPNSSFVVSIDLWEDRINQLLADNAFLDLPLDLDVLSVYNTENRLLRVFPTIKANESITGEVFINFMVIENNIVAPQEDSRQNPAYIEDYEHDHVLRAAFNQNEIGTSVFTDPAPNSTYSQDSLATGSIIIDDTWVDDNLQLLTLAYNRDTKEILQVVVTPLKDD